MKRNEWVGVGVAWTQEANVFHARAVGASMRCATMSAEPSNGIGIPLAAGPTWVQLDESGLGWKSDLGLVMRDRYQFVGLLVRFWVGPCHEISRK